MLSIVIPTRDTCALTLACLRSVTADPRGQRAELILVDDGGTDDTVARVREQFPQVRIVSLPSPAGFTKAANAGLCVATGDVLLLLNSDTETQPGALDALCDAFMQDSRLGIAGAQLVYPSGRPQWSAAQSLPGPLWLFAQASGLALAVSRLPGYRRLKPLTSGDRRVAWVTGAALTIRRDLWLQCGPLDERFRFYAQDLDLCARASAAGWTVAVVGSALVRHHQGATVAATSNGRHRQDASLLWCDLVRWVAKHRGPAQARRAARAIGLGARLRLLARRTSSWCLRGETRTNWTDDSRALGAAMTALREATR